MPLPADVGEALADYLCAGRPRCASRRVFVRAYPPFEGFSTSGALCDIIKRALRRAGLNPPRQGSYLLRHSVATTMLRQGAALSEVGELLRHRHPDTTAIYAKVDLASLRRLAFPWPEVGDHE
jgi:site-specific recombinase XerD